MIFIDAQNKVLEINNAAIAALFTRRPEISKARLWALIKRAGSQCASLLA